MAQVAVPGQRRRGFLHCRFGRQLNRQGRWRGTLMRHFLLSGPVSTLAFGMGATAAMRVLITTAGRPYRLVACLRRTSISAVAVAAITVAAQEHRGAAAGAQVASSRNIHWHSGPMGNRRRRALREILCRQRRRCWGCGAWHRNWLGGWDRCRACVSTGQSAFYSIANAGATFTQTKRALGSTVSAHPDTALWRSLPRFACQTMDCFAIHPPQALRAANPKTSIFMPQNQKPKSHPACPCLPPTKFIAARFLRKCDTVNIRGARAAGFGGCHP